MKPEPVAILVPNVAQVSGLCQSPAGAYAAYVFAHGAGAGMAHPFLQSAAQGLADRGVATLRFQFPYMERGSKRPDDPKTAQAAVRAAVAEAARRAPHTPLFAGGKSFGGRMSSLAQATEPLAALRGLIFFGFPLHPAGRPGDDRAKHLFDVHIPMLFLQGTRDKLADVRLIESLAAALGDRATLQLIPDADHSFHVPARSRRSHAEVLDELLSTATNWIQGVIDAR